jgi:glycosyltransferase 2 family protein
MGKASRSISIFIATAVTIGLLGWAFKDMDWPEVGRLLLRCHPAWLLLGLTTYVLTCVIRGWRWGIVLGASCDPGSLGGRCAAFFIGCAASAVLPSAVGDVLRISILHRRDRVPVEPTIGSIMAEKLLDIVVVFGLLLATIRPNNGLPLVQIGLGLTIACLVFWLAARSPKSMGRWAERLGSALGQDQIGRRMGASVTQMLLGLAAFRQLGRLTGALAVTLLGWLTNGVTYWSAQLALDLHGPGLSGALATQSLTAFAIALPSSPGYIGPFEAAVRLGQGLYGVAGESAIAVALLLRLMMYVMTPLLGGGLALALGVTLPTRSGYDGLRADRADDRSLDSSR